VKGGVVLGVGVGCVLSAVVLGRVNRLRRGTMCEQTQQLTQGVCDASATIARTVCDQTDTISQTVCDQSEAVSDTVCDATTTVTDSVCDSWGTIPVVGDLVCLASHSVSRAVCTASHVTSSVVCLASHVTSRTVCSASHIVDEVVCLGARIAADTVCMAERLVDAVLIPEALPEARFVVQAADALPVASVAALVQQHLGDGWEVSKLFEEFDPKRDLPQMNNLYLLRKQVVLGENAFDVGYRLRAAAGFVRVDPDLTFTQYQGHPA
jgi:hypothetical protein